MRKEDADDEDEDGEEVGLVGAMNCVATVTSFGLASTV